MRLDYTTLFTHQGLSYNSSLQIDIHLSWNKTSRSLWDSRKSQLWDTGHCPCWWKVLLMQSINQLLLCKTCWTPVNSSLNKWASVLQFMVLWRERYFFCSERHTHIQQKMSQKTELNIMLPLFFKIQPQIIFSKSHPRRLKHWGAQHILHLFMVLKQWLLIIQW